MQAQTPARQPPTPDTSPPESVSLNPIRPRSANKVRQSLDVEEALTNLQSATRTPAEDMQEETQELITKPSHQLNIEDFELVHLLGQGGVGNVWYAKKKDTGQEFAGELEQSSFSTYLHI